MAISMSKKKSQWGVILEAMHSREISIYQRSSTVKRPPSVPGGSVLYYDYPKGFPIGDLTLPT
jgi:hypothetical protein